MSRPLCQERLTAENRHFAGTGGVSANAAPRRLLPAFCDPLTGRIEVARFRDGTPAPIHVVEGLPKEWALAHDERGLPRMLRADILSGFVRDERFYTRAEAAALADA